jgi:hypothetical protein
VWGCLHNKGSASRAGFDIDAAEKLGTEGPSEFVYCELPAS